MFMKRKTYRFWFKMKNVCKMCSFDVGSPGNEKLKDGLGPRLQTAPHVNASVLRVFILEMMYALDTV